MKRLSLALIAFALLGNSALAQTPGEEHREERHEERKAHHEEHKAHREERRAHHEERKAHREERHEEHHP